MFPINLRVVVVVGGVFLVECLSNKIEKLVWREMFFVIIFYFLLGY